MTHPHILRERSAHLHICPDMDKQVINAEVAEFRFTWFSCGVLPDLDMNPGEPDSQSLPRHGAAARIGNYECYRSRLYLCQDTQDLRRGWASGLRLLQALVTLASGQTKSVDYVRTDEQTPFLAYVPCYLHLPPVPSLLFPPSCMPHVPLPCTTSCI